MSQQFLELRENKRELIISIQPRHTAGQNNTDGKKHNSKRSFSKEPEVKKI
jgi:hypothetical protein